MKKLLFSITACLSLMLLTGGCFAFINTTPLSKNNEYKNPELAGAWYTESKDGTSVIYIEDKGDHYIFHSLSSLSKIRITTSKITAADKKTEMNFLSADISFIKPEKVHPGISLYFIAGFKISDGKLSLLNFSASDKREKEAQNALPSLGKTKLFQADQAALKKFASENMNYFKDDRFCFTKCEFKDQEALRTFMILTECANICSYHLTQFSEKMSEQEEQRLNQEFIKNMKAWLNKNKQYLPPSLQKEAEVFCRVLETSENLAHKREITDFLAKANAIVFDELIKH